MTSSRENTALAMFIITTDATNIYTQEELTILIEHFFDIEMLEGLDLNTQHTNAL